MTHILEDESKTFTAVVNHDEQYSLWPSHREPPHGWTRVGPEGSRQAVLAYIETVWTDMRPQSLREVMARPLI
jgi:MbtH protein